MTILRNTSKILVLHLVMGDDRINKLGFKWKLDDRSNLNFEVAKDYKYEGFVNSVELVWLIRW